MRKGGGERDETPWGKVCEKEMDCPIPTSADGSPLLSSRPPFRTGDPGVCHSAGIRLEKAGARQEKAGIRQEKKIVTVSCAFRCLERPFHASECVFHAMERTFQGVESDLRRLRAPFLAGKAHGLPIKNPLDGSCRQGEIIIII